MQSAIQKKIVQLIEDRKKASIPEVKEKLLDIINLAISKKRLK